MLGLISAINELSNLDSKHDTYKNERKKNYSYCWDSISWPNAISVKHALGLISAINQLSNLDSKYGAHKNERKKNSKLPLGSNLAAECYQCETWAGTFLQVRDVKWFHIYLCLKKFCKKTIFTQIILKPHSRITCLNENKQKDGK